MSYPLLGTVTLGGLTISQAEKRLADGLLAGKFLKQPQVSILVTQLRGSQASVLGHAVRPGRYTLELANTRLSDLMALAGGVAPDGSDILTVVGTRDGKPFRAQIDFRTLFRERQLDARHRHPEQRRRLRRPRAPDLHLWRGAEARGVAARARHDGAAGARRRRRADAARHAAGYSRASARVPTAWCRNSSLPCKTSCSRTM